MKKYLRIIVVTITFFNNALLFGQNKTKKVYGFVEYQIGIDTSLLDDFRFEYERILNKDSSFREKGLLTKGITDKRNTTDLFIVKNNCWYVNNKSRWEIFFNGGKPVNTTIKINGNTYKVWWNKTNIYDNADPIYILELKPIGVSISSLAKYYFTLKEGVVAIDGHDFLLVRSDKKYLKLL